MCKWGTDKIVNLYHPRPVSKDKTVKVDACLAPLVQMLNDQEIETLGCCCGHYKAEGWICFIQHKEHYPIYLRIPKKDKNE